MNNIKSRLLPDFLGIGAPRSGTTWLFEHLSNHPQVWMPPIKEIHFFDRLDDPKLIKTRKLFRDLIRRTLAYISPWMSKNKLPSARWDQNYFYRRPDFDWYTSLFLPGIDKITGEITPAYSTLDAEMVDRIHNLNPGLKVIFFMRDPIERVWSSAIKSLARDKKQDAKKISDEIFLKRINGNGNMLRTNYLRTLSIWESFFPPEQIHIDFYENIQEQPREVLSRIFTFLGVTLDSGYVFTDLKKKINSTEGYKIDIPSIVEKEIARKNIDQLEELSQRFGGHTTKWLEKSKLILSDQQVNV